MSEIRCPHDSRERILAYGAGGSGKTNAWLEWLRAMPQSTAWVIDTDRAVERMVEDARFAALKDRIELCQIFDGEDFPRYKEFAKRAAATMGRDDLLVVDLADKPWSHAEEYFISRIFTEDMEEFYLQHRAGLEGSKKGGKGGALDGWKDWGVINRLYFGFANQLLKANGHVFLCCPEQKVTDEDDRDTQRLFGSVNYKPKGQKLIAHVPHTVLRFVGNQARKSWLMTTVKDRGRVELDAEPVRRFTSDYLVKVAGWERVKKEKGGGGTEDD